MLQFYGDNSEFHGDRDTEIADILLFGGILIDSVTERTLVGKVSEIKAKYCNNTRTPIKYNFKDLKREYVRKENVSGYEKMLETSNEWRKEILNEVANTDCKIIVSCIQSHETKKRDIINRKADLTYYLFSNYLMRCGLEMQERRRYDKNLECQLILDWPEGNDPKPFNYHYAIAFNAGRTVDLVRFSCGSLKTNGFRDSIMYATMENTTMLQVADLIVGSAKEFVQHCIGTKNNPFGLELVKMCRKKLRGYPSNILNRGIIVSSSNTTLRQQLHAGISTLVADDLEW